MKALGFAILAFWFVLFLILGLVTNANSWEEETDVDKQGMISTAVIISAMIALAVFLITF